jgi:hypothetical protein
MAGRCERPALRWSSQWTIKPPSSKEGVSRGRFGLPREAESSPLTAFPVVPATEVPGSREAPGLMVELNDRQKFGRPPRPNSAFQFRQKSMT